MVAVARSAAYTFYNFSLHGICDGSDRRARRPIAQQFNTDDIQSVVFSVGGLLFVCWIIPLDSILPMNSKARGAGSQTDERMSDAWGLSLPEEDFVLLPSEGVRSKKSRYNRN